MSLDLRLGSRPALYPAHPMAVPREMRFGFGGLEAAVAQTNNICFHDNNKQTKKRKNQATPCWWLGFVVWIRI